MTEAPDVAPVFAEPPAPGTPVRLLASYCEACERWEFPALGYCPTCPAAPVKRPLRTEAVVELVTAVLHQPPGALIEAPYAIVLAGFAEGLSIMGVMAGATYDQVAPGDPVETVGAAIGSTIGFQFRRSSGHQG